MGFYPVAVVILRVYKTWNWLLLNQGKTNFTQQQSWRCNQKNSENFSPQFGKKKWHNICERSLRFRVYRKKRLKWSLYRPGVAQRVGRGIALLFHGRGSRRGWVVSSTPRPKFTPGKDPVPILQEAGWAPGPVWTGGKSHPHWDTTPDRPVRSQSLYGLSYPAHFECTAIYNFNSCAIHEDKLLLSAYFLLLVSSTHVIPSESHKTLASPVIRSKSDLN